MKFVKVGAALINLEQVTKIERSGNAVIIHLSDGYGVPASEDEWKSIALATGVNLPNS